MKWIGPSLSLAALLLSLAAIALIIVAKDDRPKCTEAATSQAYINGKLGEAKTIWYPEGCKHK